MVQTGALWGGGGGGCGGVVHVAAVRGGWDGAHVLVEVVAGCFVWVIGGFCGELWFLVLGLMGALFGVWDRRGGGDGGLMDIVDGLYFWGESRLGVGKLYDIGEIAYSHNHQHVFAIY